MKLDAVVVIAVVLGWPAAFAADPLQQVWELRLAEGKNHPIIDLAFSPDGKKLAVTMAKELLIVDVENPQANLRRIDLDTCGKFIEWSPSSAALLVCERVVRLSDGKSCELYRTPNPQVLQSLQGTTHWLTTGRVILADGTIVDLGCQTAGKWAVEKEGDWAVAATAPTKGLLVLRRTTQETRNVRPLAYNDYAIADIKSHQMTSDLLLRGKLRAGSPVLAEGARVVCSEVQAVGQKTWKLQCWNLPDGEAVTLADELADFRVARGSLSSARVIAERWDYHRGNLLEKSPDLLSSMIVDLRSGKQFAAMKPRPQRDYPSGEIRDRYFRLALSPNGELLAEGGDGVVTLQRLP